VVSTKAVSTPDAKCLSVPVHWGRHMGDSTTATSVIPDIA
jgi:hypothetical protein